MPDRSLVSPPHPQQFPFRKNVEAWCRYNRRRWRMERFVPAEGERLPFVCECTSGECLHALLLTVPEYEAAHMSNDWLAVIPGHVMEGDNAEVLMEQPGFWVVELHRFPNGPWRT
jgi:hypothetical protein